MLTKGVAVVGSALLSALSFVNAGQGIAAAADGPVNCLENTGMCFIQVERPGSSGSSGTGSPGEVSDTPDRTDPREAVCYDDVRSVEVPCNDPYRGTWDADSDCYHLLAEPQPPAGDPAWQGHTGGAVYVEVCPFLQGSGGLIWLPEPPPGSAGPTMTPAQLAERAIEQLPLSAPAIRMAPDPERRGLVGVPVWMWIERTQGSWGPLERTASIPGLSVTARAHADRVTWDMGDGTTVVCTGPGTPYRSSDGANPSPDCGHVFTASSAGEPAGRFTVTASTRWRIGWSGGGRSGTHTMLRTTSTPVEVGELQVLLR